MKATCIEWDTDGDKAVLETLPKEIDIPDAIAYDEDGEINYEAIEDFLSDETGFCHSGYIVEE